ncbi:hypothetical protein CHELA40_50530 [Chelatococcus asaccharovorans]|nr:hypothetical protein CHELA17_20499 [Chelatococcus asaccharovorans]CAH1693200.1 hypothetical protein CHELA40_50530 [Chelatococcus asaccharovorans]
MKRRPTTGRAQLDIGIDSAAGSGYPESVRPPKGGGSLATAQFERVDPPCAITSEAHSR